MINDELLINKKELVDMFQNRILIDTNRGWIYIDESDNRQRVSIIALHHIEPKYLQDVANTEFYKIKPIRW